MLSPGLTSWFLTKPRTADHGLPPSHNCIASQRTTFFYVHIRIEHHIEVALVSQPVPIAPPSPCTERPPGVSSRRFVPAMDNSIVLSDGGETMTMTMTPATSQYTQITEKTQVQTPAPSLKLVSLSQPLEPPPPPPPASPPTRTLLNACIIVLIVTSSMIVNVRGSFSIIFLKRLTLLDRSRTQLPSRLLFQRYRRK